MYHNPQQTLKSSPSYYPCDLICVSRASVSALASSDVNPWRFTAAQYSATLRTMSLTIWWKQLMGSNVPVPKDCTIINAEEEAETAKKISLMSGGWFELDHKKCVKVLQRRRTEGVNRTFWQTSSNLFPFKQNMIWNVNKGDLHQTRARFTSSPWSCQITLL